MSIVKLRWEDSNDVFEVDREAIELSGFVSMILEELPSVEELQDTPILEEAILIKNGIKRSTLVKVIEFCEYHKENPLEDIEKPLRTNDLSQILSPWYFDFQNIKIEELFELTNAANYLDIKPLLELTCASVAAQMKGKSIGEIRELFNIENEFTSEE